MTESVKKVVLAYSGGLDTSVILRWLIETYDCEVIAYSADIGQEEELDPVDEKARKTGASAVYIEDLKEEFIRDFVFPAFRANVLYEGQYLLGTSIARPLIAKRQIEIAEREGADAVSHGATGKGNDQVRFELAYYALKPDVTVIAPWRTWDLTSRTALMDFARRHGIEVTSTKEKPYSMDRNMLHISYEGGILEDPWLPPPEDIYTLTVAPQLAPDTPEDLEITFENGDPVALNGQAMSPAALFRELNQIGGRHGVGRDDVVENRFVGMKSRGIYETPGGTILRKAHIAMESITMDREVMHLRDGLMPRYATLIYNGFWFAPERELIQKMIDESQIGVSGVVRIQLYKGHCRVMGRKSDLSLYDADFATFEDDVVYRQGDAEGFIRLNALRLRIRELARRKQG
ncbi:MAG: argininosuccinate synthase [Thermodesulfobacteriota bacterium]